MTEHTSTDYALEEGNGGGGESGPYKKKAALSFENAVRAANFAGEQAEKIGRTIQDGSVSMRLLAFLGAIAMIITSVLDFLVGVLHVNFTHVLISIVVCIFSVMICILEGREYLPRKIRALQSKMYDEARFLRLIIGRGMFYFFAGLLQFSHWSFLNMISGGFMMFIGLLYIIIGRATGKKLADVRAAIKDEETLGVAFAAHDTDQDGYLRETDFAEMMKWMEIDLNMNELVAAFTAIDDDDDGKVSFEDFKAWWSGRNQSPTNVL